MKDMSRALRRHHAARIKQTRRCYFGFDHRSDPRRAGMMLHTTTPCSCWMCGNPRHYGERTRAELLHVVKLAEE
jgi:hypothetical protein